jgi:hypothetical protein
VDGFTNGFNLGYEQELKNETDHAFTLMSAGFDLSTQNSQQDKQEGQKNITDAKTKLQKTYKGTSQLQSNLQQNKINNPRKTSHPRPNLSA